MKASLKLAVGLLVCVAAHAQQPLPKTIHEYPAIAPAIEDELLGWQVSPGRNVRIPIGQMPVVLTAGPGYVNPSWITSLAFSKLTGLPTTLGGYGISDPVVLSTGSYSNPSWITALAWSKLLSTPTTLAGYGITDPVALTSGSYANPSWITSLAWSKLTSVPTTLAGYGITDPVALTSGSYANPSWITSLAWSKLTGVPTTIAGYGITDPIALTSGSYANPSWITSLAWSKLTGVPSFVTSVGLTLPNIFNVSGTPVTTTGTLTAAFANQSANRLFAGPGNGAAAAPTFRAMVPQDLPTEAIVDFATYANPTWLTSLAWSKLTGVPSFEPALGNPLVNGYVLSSTTAGVRSWIPVGTGSGDMLTSTYDPDTNGIFAIAQGGTGASSAAAARSNLGVEPALGNPGTNGFVLSSTTAGVRSWISAGSGSGDMLAATYDPNTDGIFAIAQGGTNASTAAAARTNLGLAIGTNVEASLGNPGTNGFVLSSTTGGVRSWIANGSGSYDPTNVAITGGTIKGLTNPLLVGESSLSSYYPTGEVLGEFRKDQNGTSRVVLVNADTGVNALAGFNVHNGVGAISMWATGVNGTGVPVSAGLLPNFGCLTTDSTLGGLILENTTAGGRIVFIKNSVNVGEFNAADQFNVIHDFTAGQDVIATRDVIAGRNVRLAGILDCSGDLNSPWYDYVTLGDWSTIGAPESTGTTLAIGGYRASQWVGVTLHASGTEMLSVTTGGLRITPADSYLNFGATAGAGGYGIRDNAGTMESKNSGGAWTTIGGGGGGGGSASTRVTSSGAISIPDSTFTTLTFDTERWDTDAIHSTVTNTGRLTCKTAGKYTINGHFAFAANTSGLREIDVVLNGTTTIAVITGFNPPVGATYVTFGTQYDLSVNDYVECSAYQSSGGALDIIKGNNYTPEFMMTKLP